jgi:transcriptional regulator GlxA family with amidase domain
MEPRRVVFVVYPGLQSLDLCGPLEVFQGANRWLQREGRPPAYQLTIAGVGRGVLRSSAGIGLIPDAPLGGIRGPLDTLLVPGGEGSRPPLRSPALLAAIRRLAPRARRLVSVCTGAFLLAEAGLLDGRRATTHWAYCGALARRHPRIQVEPDPIYVRDGRIYTSAGVTAGMDLALALVEEDVGRPAALAIARWLVLFLYRTGGQAQFSAQLQVQLADREPLREVQQFVADHPEAELSVEALAERAAMSVRHFARCFRREVGVSPARFVDDVRVEAARRRLVESQDGVEQVAARCGFRSAEVLRRAFVKRVGIPPAAYRIRFGSAIKEEPHANRLSLVRRRERPGRRRGVRSAEQPAAGGGRVGRR